MEESVVDPVEERSVEEDDGKTTNATECGAKVIAGEVIRNWQTKTRSKGLHDLLHSLFDLFSQSLR